MDARALLRPLVGFALHPWFRLTRGVTLGVRALVFDGEGRVLLVSHTYLPGWHLPGGGVEPGESIETAMRRELAEEACVEITGAARLLGIAANFDAMARDHIAVYEVRAWRATAGRPPPLEIREARFFSVDALPDGVSAGTRRRIGEALAGAPVAANW